MNAFDNAVDIAAEHTRDRETEAAHGGEGRPECEAGNVAMSQRLVLLQ